MKTILKSGIMAGLIASAAMGQGEHIPPHEGGKKHHTEKQEEMFKRMDRDGDGKISKQEFFASPRMAKLPEEQRNALFRRLDRDEDGAISREEIRMMRRHAAHRAKVDFRKLDEDQNGSVSFEEFIKGEFISKLPEEKQLQIFKRMDTDGNGMINEADHPRRPLGKPHSRPEREIKD